MGPKLVLYPHLMKGVWQIWYDSLVSENLNCPLENNCLVQVLGFFTTNRLALFITLHSSLKPQQATAINTPH